MSHEETIFTEALGKGSAAEREAYLDTACGGDAALRRGVENLLAAHGEGEGILEHPPAAFASSATVTVQSAPSPPSESIGTMIGPYKLLEPIGDGGMGVVFMAEQLRPVRRRVALKIIKPGMDSRQVIARFEAERQALAMMDHPNIAMVFDAGMTPTGRPFFVMELVKGIPITAYCDEARLTTRERLELFITVCHAVQHAHQKGIIHRDLKPSNVLVTLHDDKPVAKVIDFGIAKAAGQALTDKTLFTNFAQMLGTPLYMSPEQAQISGLDVDTRSDVYSLGVLLYELLTGTTPFDKDRLRAAAYDEMRRIIREEDPPNPSTRLSTMGEKIASVSAVRHTEPKKLSQAVRGELDWIVMKSLEKDRARRYETANGLAHDVERHLNDQPVEACPPSGFYRFRKFARRNRVALAFTGVGALSIVLLLVLAVVSNVRIGRALAQKDDALAAAEASEADARASEAAAKASEAAAKEQERKAVAERVRAEGYFLKVRTVVDQMVKRLQTADVAGVPQVEKLRGELVRDLLTYYDGLLNRPSTRPSDLYDTARAYRMTAELRALVSDRDQAEADLRNGIAILDKLTQQFPDDRDARHVLAASNASLAKLLAGNGRFEEAESGYRRAIDIWSKLTVSFPTIAHYRSSTGNGHLLLFGLLKEHGDPGEAEQAYRQILVSFEKDVQGSPTDLAKQAALVDAWRLAGDVLRLSKRPDEAQQAYASGIAICTNLCAAAPRDIPARLLLADSLRDSGELDRALEEYSQAAASRTTETPTQLQAILAVSVAKLARLLPKETDPAERAYRLAISIREPLLSKSTPQMRLAHSFDYNELATVLMSAKRLSQAEEASRAGLALKQELAAEFPDDLNYAMHVAHSQFSIGYIARDAGRSAEAADAFRSAEKVLHEVAVHNPGGTEGVASWCGRTHWQLSDAWRSLQRLDDAERACVGAMNVFQALAAQHPSDAIYPQEQAMTHRHLAAVAKDAGRGADALSHYAEAFEGYKRLLGQATDPTFYCNEMFYTAGQWTEALAHGDPAERETNAARTQAVMLETEQAITQAIARQPPTPELLKLRAHVLEWRGKDAEALAAFTELIAAQPGMVTAWAARGWLHVKRRECDKSELDFAKVIELDPNGWEGWSGRAFSHFHRHQWQKAIADYSKAIELEPNLHMNWHHRGHAYLAVEQWDKAAGDFGKIAEKWPHDFWALHSRANAYSHLGRPAEAVADLRQAIARGFKDTAMLKSDPNFEPIRGDDAFKKLLAELDAPGTATPR